MPQFDISTYYSQLFWLIITFSLLYICVYKFIAPKAERILNNRNFNIQDNIAQTDKLALEVEKLNRYYNKEVEKIKNEVDKLKKEKIDSLTAEFLIKKNKLEKELLKSINQNIIDIDSAAKEFRTAKAEAVIKLAAGIIEKITDTKADIKLLKNIKVQ
ncbi:MAG: ATP F0F1 synthase subunit B' [Rickettsia endosymbiont of Argas persicus]